MVTTDATLQLTLDLVGVFVFALSGGLVAVRRGLDLFGVLVLAWVAGLGGGILRDLLIGSVPPVGVSDVRMLGVAAVAGLLVFLGYARASELARTRPALHLRELNCAVRVLDAAGLALFAVSGSLKALGLGMPAVTAILVGGVTAVGGGALRDLLAGQVPEVLQRELYAVPALLGSALVVGLDRWGWLTPVSTAGCVLLIFTVRMVAVVLDLHAPKPLRTHGS